MARKVEKQVIYKADDGAEFATEAEAIRHDKITEAHRDFERSRKKYGKLLLETQKTADGVAFDLDRWSEYWAVLNTFRTIPDIRPIRFSKYNFDFHYDDDDVLYIVHKEDGQNPRRFKINELYSTREAAAGQLLTCLDEFRSLIDEEIERFKDMFPALAAEAK